MSLGTSHILPGAGEFTRGEVTIRWRGRPRAGQRQFGPDALDLYQRHGTEFVKRLGGSFALAVLDGGAEDRVLLARDRAGAVPLYVAETPEGEPAAATTIGGLLPVTGPPRLNPAALLDYLTFFWSLDDKTFFEGVRLVPPGAVCENGRFSRYFDYVHEPEERPAAVWREEIVSTLAAAVADCARPGTGCHLSGGIDSSLVALLAARALGPAPPTFGAWFPAYPAYDECPHAEELARAIGSEFHRVAVTPETFPTALPRLMAALEEPKCHPPVFPRQLLADAAHARGVRTTLTGRGADELFTGYDSHRPDQLDRHRERRTLFAPARRAELFREGYEAGTGYSPEERYDQVFGACPGATPLEQILAFDWRTLMANWMVIDYKVSNARGIACEAPFLARPVIDLAMRIPLELKCPGDRPKQLLRDAVAGLLPESTITRRKVGFRTPMGELLREGLEPYARQQLAEDGSAFWDVFSPAGVAGLVDTHFGGGSNQGWQVWALLCVREWFRRYIDEEDWSR